MLTKKRVAKSFLTKNPKFYLHDMNEKRDYII